MKTKKLRKKGFTLVELVIVIAIVIVLSVVSVPIYRSYVDKAKMSEGYALLGTVLSAQKAYYSEFGNFIVDGLGGLGWVSYDSIIGIDGRGNKYFTYFYVGGSGGQNYEKYYFYSGAKVPAELQKNGDYELMLVYNITQGSTVIGYPSGSAIYNGWKNP